MVEWETRAHEGTAGRKGLWAMPGLQGPRAPTVCGDPKGHRDQLANLQTRAHSPISGRQWTVPTGAGRPDLAALWTPT